MMTILRKIQLAFPQRPKRMEKIETLQLGPAHCLHLVSVDGRELLVAIGTGSPVVIPAPAGVTPREAT